VRQVRATLRLGRIAGIRVGVHWSVLVIFVIIAVGLAEGRLPEAHPGRPPWQYWAAGILAAVVFFASLLAHEIAHAVVARHSGVEADDITLWLLGGTARLKEEAPSPGAELRIAGVGPLVSLVLGVAFAAVAGALRAAGSSGLTVEAVAWLAGINLTLAVFNALPAAPLDGGRLLRDADRVGGQGDQQQDACRDPAHDHRQPVAHDGVTEPEATEVSSATAMTRNGSAGGGGAAGGCGGTANPPAPLIPQVPPLLPAPAPLIPNHRDSPSRRTRQRPCPDCRGRHRSGSRLRNADFGPGAAQDLSGGS
jgi:Zn-dependent protease